MMDMLVLVREETEKKFPNAGYNSVGCYFFLRYLCPMMTVPEALGLLVG